MKLIMIIGAALLVTACSKPQPAQQNEAAAAEAQRRSDAESDAYMRKAETDWAQLFVKDDPNILQNILADDFTGFSSDGKIHDKAETVAAEKPDGSYKSATLDSAEYHHFGDTVVAQGIESAQRRDGGPDYRIAWTDVWMYRNGKWQVIAAHSAPLPAKK